MRELPFTAEILDALVGRYVVAVWPLPVVAPVLALLALALMLRPLPGGGRAAAALLAAAWAGVGIDFHIRTVAAIDFLAPVYGGFFLVQAALLTWSGVLRGRLAGGPPRAAGAWIGFALAVLAIAGYPLLALLAGRSWPGLPIVGVTPDPTVMLTLGLVLLGAGRPPLHLLVVPALWALVAGVTGWMLDTPERLPLSAAAATAIVLAVSARRARKTT